MEIDCFESRPRVATLDAVVGKDVEAYRLTFDPHVLATSTEEDRSRTVEAILNSLDPRVARGEIPRDPTVLRGLAGPGPSHRVRVTVAARPGGGVETKYEILEDGPEDDGLSAMDFFRRLDRLVAAKLLEVGVSP